MDANKRQLFLVPKQGLGNEKIDKKYLDLSNKRIIIENNS